MSLQKKSGAVKSQAERKRGSGAKTEVRLSPDVHGEAAAAGYRVLIGAFQSDGGFGPPADFTAENHRLPEGAHHV